MEGKILSGEELDFCFDWNVVITNLAPFGRPWLALLWGAGIVIGFYQLAQMIHAKELTI